MSGPRTSGRVVPSLVTAEYPPHGAAGAAVEGGLEALGQAKPLRVVLVTAVVGVDEVASLVDPGLTDEGEQLIDIQDELGLMAVWPHLAITAWVAHRTPSPV